MRDCPIFLINQPIGRACPKTWSPYPTALLSGVKRLNTSTYALQILRFAQEDRGKGKAEQQFSDRLG